ncbi:hypothetical protein Y1Q_0021369 [Alligator mississippiensis]|uniref:Uncharacterized protein n=1 Tax=Alligator mississippiensis TaxID=8496 RepID=A0A151P9E0_ALLMI|nr:hypothetical protein Y1Q_0021369 [Alligator mississippiensis]
MDNKSAPSQNTREAKGNRELTLAMSPRKERGRDTQMEERGTRMKTKTKDCMRGGSEIRVPAARNAGNGRKDLKGKGDQNYFLKEERNREEIWRDYKRDDRWQREGNGRRVLERYLPGKLK